MNISLLLISITLLLSCGTTQTSHTEAELSSAHSIHPFKVDEASSIIHRGWNISYYDYQSSASWLGLNPSVPEIYDFLNSPQDYESRLIKEERVETLDLDKHWNYIRNDSGKAFSKYFAAKMHNRILVPRRTTFVFTGSSDDGARFFLRHISDELSKAPSEIEAIPTDFSSYNEAITNDNWKIDGATTNVFGPKVITLEPGYWDILGYYFQDRGLASLNLTTRIQKKNQTTVTPPPPRPTSLLSHYPCSNQNKWRVYRYNDINMYRLKSSRHIKGAYTCKYFYANHINERWQFGPYQYTYVYEKEFIVNRDPSWKRFEMKFNYVDDHAAVYIQRIDIANQTPILAHYTRTDDIVKFSYSSFQSLNPGVYRIMVVYTELGGESSINIQFPDLK